MVSNKFQRMGFIDSELLHIKKITDSSYQAEFHLGPIFENLKIYYSSEFFNKTDLERIASKVTDTSFQISIETIPISMQKLTAFRNEQGNAFARIRLSEFEKDANNHLSARLIVDDGNIRTVDSIAIKGYEKFPRSFLKYYAGVRTGKVFNKKTIVQQSEILNSLGFVSSIKPPEALFRKDATVVYFYLEKQNNNLFDGILGFATDEETQKLTFNGYLNLELNNNLNFGEQLLLNYKADGQEQVNFRAKVAMPYILKTPFGLSAELKIFKRDSSFVNTEQQLRATYQINPRSTAYIGYSGYDSSNLLDIAVAGMPVEDFKSKFIIMGGTYLRPQNKKLFPIKTVIGIDGGLGVRDTQGKSDTQVRTELLVNNIFNLNYKNSIFVQSSTSALFSDGYLVNELFRFGGINSIRGFNENSIDASLFSVLNTEYRFEINEGAFVHSIIDLGYFENESLSLKQNLYSFGLGFGLNTQAGLFKLNVANGNTQDQDFSFSNTKIHISVSTKF